MLGAALLATAGFTAAVLAMAAVLAVILAVILVAMPSGLPTGRKGAKFSEVFSKSSNVNWLSAARVTLFGARDVWFVVGIPIYFYAVLSDGSTEGNRAAFFMIGTFMAVWIILYGAVQAAAPRLLRAASRPQAELIGAARGWAAVLAVVPALLAIAVGGDAGSGPVADSDARRRSAGLRRAVRGEFLAPLLPDPGLPLRAERVTMDVGFYYMANAAGRLIGTVLSGLTYQLGGLPLTLGTAAVPAALLGVVGRTPAANGARNGGGLTHWRRARLPRPSRIRGRMSARPVPIRPDRPCLAS